MKVKILIAPLLIVSIIMIIAWQIQPAFTAFNSKRAASKEVQDKADKIKEKVNNMNAINAKMSNEANKSRRESLYQYIPEAMKEEDIINNLNRLASVEGLTVSGISVSPPEKQVAPVEEIITIEGESVDGQPAVPQKVSPDTFNVELSVAGSYDSIKRMFNQIYKLERYNSMEEFDLRVTRKEGESVGDNLTALANIKFAYFVKKMTPVDPYNPVFDSNVIRDQAIDDIAKSKNVDILRPVVDASQRPNPFLP